MFSFTRITSTSNFAPEIINRLNNPTGTSGDKMLEKLGSGGHLSLSFHYIFPSLPSLLSRCTNFRQICVIIKVLKSSTRSCAILTRIAFTTYIRAMSVSRLLVAPMTLRELLMHPVDPAYQTRLTSCRYSGNRPPFDNESSGFYEY
jgi:hypothetical protein